MPATSSVVSGVATVEPAGAFNTPLNSASVSMSIPPVTMTTELQPSGNVYLPTAVVVTLTSPAEATPSPLVSHVAVAALR